MQELNKDIANKYYARGMAHSKDGDYDCAIEAYTQVIELKPDCAEAYYNRGVAHSKKGEVQLAIEDYNEAIHLKPDYADAYYKRSRAWLHLNEPEKAKSDMKIASNIGISSSAASDDILHTYKHAWKVLGNL